MKRSTFLYLVALLVVVALGLIAYAAEAQTEEPGDVTLPPLVEQLKIGGVLVAPILVMVVQLLKRLGLPDGYAGYAALILSVLALALGAFAGYYGFEQQAGESLRALEMLVNAVMIFLAQAGGSLAWYAGLKKAEVVGRKP